MGFIKCTQCNATIPDGVSQCPQCQTLQNDIAKKQVEFTNRNSDYMPFFGMKIKISDSQKKKYSQYSIFAVAVLLSCLGAYFGFREFSYHSSISQGKKHLESKEWSQASNSFNAALSIHKDSVAASEGIADSLSGQKKWHESAELYSLILNFKQIPIENLQPVQKKAALAYFYDGQFENSLKTFKNMESSVFATDKMLNSAFLISQARSVIQATPISKLIPYNVPDKTGALYDQANLTLIGLEKILAQIPTSGSEPEISGAITPISEYILHAKARIYRFKNKFNESIQKYDEIIKFYPHNANYIFERANLNYENNQQSASVTDLKQAIKINPDFYPALYLLGKIYYEQQKMRSAQHHFLLFDSKYNQAVTAVNHNESEYLNNKTHFEVLKILGGFFDQSGSIKNSIFYYQRALERI